MNFKPSNIPGNSVYINPNIEVIYDFTEEISTPSEISIPIFQPPYLHSADHQLQRHLLHGNHDFQLNAAKDE